MAEARATYAPILAAYSEVAALARQTIMTVSPDQHKILSSAIELFVNTPRGAFGSVLGAEPNLDAVVRVATQRSNDSKATSITERHWDPDKPGEVSETRWDRPVDDDSDDNRVSAAAAAAEDDTSATAPAAAAAAAGGDAAPPAADPVEPAGYAVLDRILGHLQHMLGNGGDGLPSAISPILVVLKNVAQENAVVRRYLKPRVAPRERDLSCKPEDGHSLRAMLTKQLTSYGNRFSVLAWSHAGVDLVPIFRAATASCGAHPGASAHARVRPRSTLALSPWLFYWLATHLCASIGRAQTQP